MRVGLNLVKNSTISAPCVIIAHLPERCCRPRPSRARSGDGNCGGNATRGQRRHLRMDPNEKTVARRPEAVKTRFAPFRPSLFQFPPRSAGPRFHPATSPNGSDMVLQNRSKKIRRPPARLSVRPARRCWPPDRQRTIPALRETLRHAIGKNGSAQAGRGIARHHLEKRGISAPCRRRSVTGKDQSTGVSGGMLSFNDLRSPAKSRSE